MDQALTARFRIEAGHPLRGMHPIGGRRFSQLFSSACFLRREKSSAKEARARPPLVASSRFHARLYTVLSSAYVSSRRSGSRATLVSRVLIK